MQFAGLSPKIAIWLSAGLMYSKLASGGVCFRKGFGFWSRLLQVVGKSYVVIHGLSIVCLRHSVSIESVWSLYFCH